MQIDVPYELIETLVMEVLKRNKVAIETEQKKENDCTKEEESKFTVDDVRTRLKKLDPAKAREMLKRFNVQRLSEVDPAQYEDMIAILDQEGA